MYSSNVFKNAAVLMEAEPFRLNVDQLEELVPESDHAEDIGTRIEAIEREAYERGFAAGEKAGFEFGRQKAEVLFNGIEGLLNELASFKPSLFAKCEKEMAELCLAVAKKVIHRETAIKEDGVLDCLKAAMRSVVAGGEIAIKVNPKDLDIVNSNRTELARFCGGVKGMSVESDASLTRGGAVITTNFGEIDATIETALMEIEEKLIDAYSGN